MCTLQAIIKNKNFLKTQYTSKLQGNLLPESQEDKSTNAIKSILKRCNADKNGAKAAVVGEKANTNLALFKYKLIHAKARSKEECNFCSCKGHLNP